MEGPLLADRVLRAGVPPNIGPQDTRLRPDVDCLLSGKAEWPLMAGSGQTFQNIQQHSVPKAGRYLQEAY